MDSPGRRRLAEIDGALRRAEGFTYSAHAALDDTYYNSRIAEFDRRIANLQSERALLVKLREDAPKILGEWQPRIDKLREMREDHIKRNGRAATETEAGERVPKTNLERAVETAKKLETLRAELLSEGIDMNDLLRESK